MRYVLTATSRFDNHGSSSSIRRPDAVLLGSSINIKKIGVAVDE